MNMPSEPIRVLIADDHGVVREGLRTLLVQAGFVVVALAATGEEALTLTLQQRPQVLLLDLRMPGLDGLQVLEQVRAAAPEVAVVVLTTYDNPVYLHQALRLGAAGFLTKDADPQVIPLAVRAAVQGFALVARGVLQRALAAAGSTAPPPTATDVEGREAWPEGLTEQEVRVLRLVAQGLTNQEIAERLHISLHTVKTHLKHIFAKLGVSDRTQAAVWAWRRGLGQ